ncbi:hypothetical protein ONZ45_g18136 [Pleurotus djamor]|nr:hypothetical protein ONZ45_g18136 [Pleurotus djamor]
MIVMTHVGNLMTATISNPNTSEAAKDHARDKLAELQPEVDPNADYVDDEGEDLDDEELFLGDDALDSDNDLSGGNAAQGKHVRVGGNKKRYGNVIGGHKATLKNPNVGEKAKKHSEDVLRDEGEL